MKKTNKLLSIILAILMVMTTVPFAFAADETPTTREVDGKIYYELDSADKLYWFAEQVNGGNVEINAILTDDIVVNENLLSEKLILTEKIETKISHRGGSETVKVCVAEVKTGENVREWIPMGTELWENMYSGHFNGNGKTISGLYVNEMYDYAGLVGNAYGCTIENLTLEDSYFNCEYNFAGAFVAFAENPYDGHVYLKNLVNKSIVCGRCAGGIVGCVQGTTEISGCINLETVYPFSINYHEYKGGGIAGTIQNEFSATDCVNLGNAEYAFGSINDSFTNCYYLDTASKGVPFDTNNVLAVTAEEVASGFVCEKIGGHKTEVITEEPTCTENGFEKIECLICEYSAIQKEIPATNHNDTLVQVEAKAPTCTEIGWNAYEYCTACDYTTYTEKEALDHDIVIDEAVAPKCDETGLTAGQHCSRCDAMTVVQEVVPALTHKDEDGDYKCDYSCGHEFEKPVEPDDPDVPNTPDEPDTPDEPTDETCTDCGKVHTNFFSEIICFFIRIFNFIKNLFA